MTRKEAQIIIGNIPIKSEALDDCYDITEYQEAKAMAIKVLEQEPCEDCISRKEVTQSRPEWLSEDVERDTDEQTVVDRAFNRGWNSCLKEFLKNIKELPSVTPQPKMGQWIMKHRTYNRVKYYTGQDEMGEPHTISVLERYEVDEPYCSKCGKLAGDTSQDFCCACGAKMEVKE